MFIIDWFRLVVGCAWIALVSFLMLWFGIKLYPRWVKNLKNDHLQKIIDTVAGKSNARKQHGPTVQQPNEQQRRNTHTHHVRYLPVKCDIGSIYLTIPQPLSLFI